MNRPYEFNRQNATVGNYGYTIKVQREFSKEDKCPSREFLIENREDVNWIEVYKHPYFRALYGKDFIYQFASTHQRIAIEREFMKENKDIFCNFI